MRGLIYYISPVDLDLRVCRTTLRRVVPHRQCGLGISLMAIGEGMMFKSDAAEKMRGLVKAGAFGFGVFECNDPPATYEEPTAKGVEFSKPPAHEFYDSGNWSSLGEKNKD